MTEIEDLKPCNYFPVAIDNLVAVGWLGREIEFETGKVSLEFFRKLSDLCTKPWQPLATAGLHTCQLCQFDPPSFSANVFIPHRQQIYVAPVGILHYITAHWYRPPAIFIKAVLACPPMNDMAYKKAILANGGRQLIRAASPEKTRFGN